MGRELLEREPAFRRALRACDEAIARHAGWSVLAAVREGAVPEGRADRDQSLLFALQVALARLWASLGVRPAAVIGHSMGEVAAAHLAGALSLDEAARLICRRSERIRTLTGKGTMAVVEASASEMERLLARWGTRVSCAARNGPRSFVLAGDADAIAAVIAEREAAGAFARPAGFDHISHCAAAEPLSGPLARDLEGLAPRRGEVPIYSTVHGRVTDGTDMDAGYWIRQILQPVLFHEQALALLRDGIDVLLEVSPHPVLVHACEQTAAEAGAPAIILDTLRRGKGQRYLYETLARLHQAGVEVRWPATLPRGGRIVPLPPYPFQRQRLWPDALDRAAAADHDAAPAGALPAEAEPAPELPSMEEALRASPGAPPAALVEAYLRHQAGALLRLLPDAVPPGLSLKRLGLDSLMAMRLNNRVRAALGVDAPAALYLEERSLASLAAALREGAAHARARTQDAAALVAQMEEGSL